MGYKFWIGISGEDDHKPTDFEQYLVFDEDSLQEVQAMVADWMAESYLNEEEGIGE